MKFHLECDVEADTLMLEHILENVIKITIERTFFIEAKVTNLKVIVDDISAKGIQKTGDV